MLCLSFVVLLSVGRRTWEHCNGILHDNEMGALIVQLNADITSQFYLDSANLPRSTQQLFTSLPILLTSLIPHRQMWLHRVIASRQRADQQRPYSHER